MKSGGLPEKGEFHPIPAKGNGETGFISSAGGFKNGSAVFAAGGIPPRQSSFFTRLAMMASATLLGTSA